MLLQVEDGYGIIRPIHLWIVSLESISFSKDETTSSRVCRLHCLLRKDKEDENWHVPPA